MTQAREASHLIPATAREAETREALLYAATPAGVISIWDKGPEGTV